MAAVGVLFKSVLMLGIVVTGLVYIISPSHGKEIAKRVCTVAIAIYAANFAVSYLWSDGVGRFLLIAVVISLAAKLASGRGE